MTSLSLHLFFSLYEINNRVKYGRKLIGSLSYIFLLCLITLRVIETLEAILQIDERLSRKK